MLCFQQRRDATCRTTPANLNLQVDLEAIFTSLYMPFTSPPNSPTQGTCGPPPRRQVAKNGTGPRLPMRAQKHAAAIWSPSPNTYKYAGQRCVNDVPAGAPPNRPRSVAYDRHACRPAWSIYRHVPRSPVAHGGLRRPQAYGWQRSDAAYGDGAPPVPPGARSAHRWHGCPGATDGGRSYLKRPPRSRFRGHGPPSENAPQLHKAPELAPQLPTSGDRRSFEPLPRTSTKPSSIWISPTSSPTNSLTRKPHP